MIRSLVLHRAWIPVVVAVTVAAFVPRAREAMGRMSEISRAVGVQGWAAAEPNEFGDTRFRWMKREASLQEPVRGRVILVPVFVADSPSAASPASIRVTVAGLDAPPIVLRGGGWHTAKYDLYLMFGESSWKSLKAVTLSFAFTDLPVDASLPRVGLGDVHWIGPSPGTGNSRWP